MKDVEYSFTAKTYLCASEDGIGGWTFVSLPKEISMDIRENFKRMEEGWGRLKVVAKINESEWQTAIWFDTKQDTYLLPLKAMIRKKENIGFNDEVKVTIYI